MAPPPPPGPHAPRPSWLLSDVPYALIVTTALVSPFVLGARSSSSNYPLRLQIRDLLKGFGTLVASIVGAGGIVVAGGGIILGGEALYRRWIASRGGSGGE